MRQECSWILACGQLRSLKDAVELIKIDRLHQMRQETSPLCFDQIFGHSVPRQRDPSKAVIITQPHHQIDAAAVRQPEVADDKIEGVLEGSENERERFLTDPNAIVAYRYNKLSWAGIRRAHGDLAASGRELDCVLDQIPEYLINSGVVASDMMLVGRQFEAEH